MILFAEPVVAGLIYLALFLTLVGAVTLLWLLWRDYKTGRLW